MKRYSPPNSCWCLKADLFQDISSVWERLRLILKLRPIKRSMVLPLANAGWVEADAVPDAVQQALRQALSATASGVKSRYGIDWGGK